MAREHGVSRVTLAASCAATLVALSGCSHDIEGPEPVVTETDPGLLCGEQLTTEVVLTGDGFSPLPLETVTGEPGVALPQISVTRSRTPDGSETSGEPVVINPDPSDPDDDSVRWTSQQELSFLVRPEDGLEPGVYDVTVENANGERTTLEDAFTVVPPPEVTGVEPQPMCVEEQDRMLTVSGEGFLRVDGQEPTVRIGGMEQEVTDMSGCMPLVGYDGAETCTEMTVTVPQDGYDEGQHMVEVTNPDPASCMSEEPVTLTIVPAPTLESVDPQPVCNAQGETTVTLTGTGFVVDEGETPTVTVGGVEADSVEVGSCSDIEGTDAQSCTEATATLAMGSLDPGVHEVELSNPEAVGCSTMETVTLSVVPPPTVESVTPTPVCVDDGVTVRITGTGFLVIDGTQPTVSFGMTLASSVTVDESTCTPVEGVDDAQSCTELDAVIDAGALEEGEHMVTVVNPTPADCASMDEVTLEVIPPPEITGVSDTTMCTGGGSIVATGTNLFGVTAELVDSDGGVVEAQNVSVNEDGTQATITFAAGLRPEDYTLRVFGAGGCGDTLDGTTITVMDGPVAFFLEPPAMFNGVSIRGTVFVSGMTEAPGSVVVTPAGGGDETALGDVSWDAGDPNVIDATIPSGMSPGTYDLFVKDVGECDMFLGEALEVVEDVTIALDDPPVRPQFGEQGNRVSVSVFAEPDSELAADEVNFEPTPRVYLSHDSLDTAVRLRAVAFENDTRLSAVIPDTLPDGSALPAGSYDLTVVNPDNAVGFAADAFTVTTGPPPVIDSVTPTQVENDAPDDQLTIEGTSFTDPEVDLICRDPSGTETTYEATIDSSSDTELTVTIPDNSMMIEHGSICVVRVTNTTLGAFDEFSAITVTNPAAKLPPFIDGTDMVEGRRAPSSALGDATREARFFYAIGGDAGDVGSAKTTAEAAPLGRFGDIGPWTLMHPELPSGRTQGRAIQGGGWVYLLGGKGSGGSPTDSIMRARILDPFDAPEVTDVDLRFFSSPDGDPTTRDGLGPGSWTYVVTALYADTDPENPGGESLPSEPVTIYAPDVPDGVEVELTWDEVLGADGSAAVGYRIYRTTAPDLGVQDLRLLEEVGAGTTSFVDLNEAFLDDTRPPPRLGSLGEWMAYDTLSTPRALFDTVVARDPGCDTFLYAIGGETDAATESATYEYASWDPATGALGTFTEETGDALVARSELGTWVADEDSSAFITPDAGDGCKSVVYAGYGQGAGGFVTDAQLAEVLAGGTLDTWSDAVNAPASVSLAGYASFFSSDGAYAVGGETGGAMATSDVIQTPMCDGTTCDPPVLQNWSDASNDMSDARYLPGFARQGAFFYLAGGADETGTPLTSSELNVR